MVGGSSQIPIVRRHLAVLMQSDPVDPECFEPLTAVSRGAALAAAALAGEVDTAFNVISSHALGTRTKGRDGEFSFSEVIPRGAPLPFRGSKSYRPELNFVRDLAVQVWEGDPDEPLESDVNVKLADLKLPIDPPRPCADVEFDLEYRYDIDGVLHVTAREARTGQTLLRDAMSPVPRRPGRSRVGTRGRIADLRGVVLADAAPPARRPASPPGVAFVSPTAVPQQRQAGHAGASPARPTLSPTRVTLVVDGSNLACVGRQVREGVDRPSFSQLTAALDAIRAAYDDAQVVVVVDANFRHRVSDTERGDVERAVAENRLVAPPAGARGKGDALVLAIANEMGGIVVSNDSFQPFQAQYPWLREGRMLGAVRVGDMWFFQALGNHRHHGGQRAWIGRDSSHPCPLDRPPKRGRAIKAGFRSGGRPANGRVGSATTPSSRGFQSQAHPEVSDPQATLSCPALAPPRSRQLSGPELSTTQWTKSSTIGSGSWASSGKGPSPESTEYGTTSKMKSGHSSTSTMPPGTKPFAVRSGRCGRLSTPTWSRSSRPVERTTVTGI